MTIMTTLGGLGGYLVRARQTHDVSKPRLENSGRVIDVVEHVPERPSYGEKIHGDWYNLTELFRQSTDYPEKFAVNNAFAGFNVNSFSTIAPLALLFWHVS